MNIEIGKLTAPIIRQASNVAGGVREDLITQVLLANLEGNNTQNHNQSHTK
jgi:hypothetical protein